MGTAHTEWLNEPTAACRECRGPKKLNRFPLCWKCDKKAEFDRGYRDGYKDGHQDGLEESRATSQATAQPSLEGSRIRQLLQLCHPDKHGNSPVANDVTAWLLKQREPRRGRR